MENEKISMTDQHQSCNREIAALQAEVERLTSLAKAQSDYRKNAEKIWDEQDALVELLTSYLRQIAKPALGGKQQQYLAQEALSSPSLAHRNKNEKRTQD